ncbi:MAG: hypothetical protein USCAAHI_03032 [Beijerinckiaceae bacterium]|nr:MAG: hypothetical protein USCAAHI_03032 [Beijerinckiaceae bacterium]
MVFFLGSWSCFAISFSIINALWLEEKDLAAAERAASAADGV